MIDRGLAKELIPSIGDRAKFLKNLDNWIKITNPECPEFSSCSSPPTVFVDMLNPKHKQIKSVSEFIAPLNKNNTSTQLNDSNSIIPPTIGENEEACSGVDLDMTICNEDECPVALSKTQVTEVKEILEQLQLLNKNDEHYEEVESILAFMLLPLLLGNPTHRTKKQVWRPSKAEVKDGFITHVLRPMDVQAAIAHRREKYLRYKLTLQPVIVIVGSSYTDIQKYFV
ncbi:hypothetical protein B5X24_HaOG215686, partial [Helicoverpa armigera]